MPNKMLIDAIHPEETRVVVLRDKRVEDFDFEAASKKPLRGNIYLAKVTRVEPSLQAAFVEYGGNRHGFLAFSEIHPDYYQIPQADRAALLAEERGRSEDEDDAPKKPRNSRRRTPRGSEPKAAPKAETAPAEAEDDTSEAPTADAATTGTPADTAAPSQMAAATPSVTDSAASDADDDAPVTLDRAIAQVEATIDSEAAAAVDNPARDVEVAGEAESAEDAPGSSDAAPAEAAADDTVNAATDDAAPEEAPAAEAVADAEAPAEDEKPKRRRRTTTTAAAKKPATTRKRTTTATKKPATRKPTTKKSDDGLDTPVMVDDEALREDADDDTVTSFGEQDALEEIPERRRSAPRRQYKIQEVIKRRQIILVQVVKEERGTKGAALTTYLSLAGRYSVLMPNTDRGGGVSRKITDNADRKRLKASVAELEVPEGMGIILRTAAAARTKTEIKRDFEYLIRMWESVRDLTLSSIAPKLVYEEGNLVKRAIRDLYNKEIDEVLVSGENAYREAKDFMKMLMPSHAKNVKRYAEATPIFTRYGVEPQLDAMFSEHVKLPSGGYLVINPTEALVSIDVNSGRSTKESSIEDTATKTNLEAADEVARQLRLRDLAGLIVIDFIDMDDKRHNRQVEKRLKDALKLDRSRIQVGRISPFGLLEMSRQRIRQGMVETSVVPCEACGGTGHVRSTQSVALHCLRTLEDYLLKNSDNHVTIKTSATVALYILNQKRQHLSELEERFQLEIGVDADESLSGAHLAIVAGPAVDRAPGVELPTTQIAPEAVVDEDEDETAEEETTTEARGEPRAEARGDTQGDGQGDRSSRRRRRRRRRGGGGGDDRRGDMRGDEDGDNGETFARGARDSAHDDDADESATDETTADERADGDEAESTPAEVAAEGTAEADDRAEFDSEDDDRRGRRRRGRRGGRRHRREDEDDTGETETVTADAAEDAVSDTAVAADEDAVAEDVAAGEAEDTRAEADTGAEAEARPAEAEEAAPERKSAPRQRRSGWWQSSASSPELPAVPQAAPAEAEVEASPAASDEAAPEDKSEQPQRRAGWWQRRSFF
ncbi:Rne/Rng family ribonuclease [Acuticoccus yangtzensis]|uniref:Rne/Rng family ribonuclease n=1 Tax=Acuticoccus yangtzensis TaxID=1443441 RepID=UPI0009499625|nr:Rne/Rng family ribonuclease [Acuticoccus yangtzensis]